MGSYVETDTPRKENSIPTPSSFSRMSFGAGTKDATTADLSASLGDTSTFSQSFPAESRSVIVGPGGVLTPRSSILMNPSNKKTFVDAWRLTDGSGPAVLHIAAPQNAKDRESEKERDRIEREKEIERELKEMEQAEKVWGIPKKAFYMGLGDINFNAQMAMLGGWGNGSGPATDFRPNLVAPLPRRLSSGGNSAASTIKKGSKGVKKGKNPKKKPGKGMELEKMKQQAAAAAAERELAERKIKENEKDAQEDSDESIDPEELAALNAIINTRRSMEAAQALASRQNRASQLKKPNSSQASLNNNGDADRGDGRPSNGSYRSSSRSVAMNSKPDETGGDGSPKSFATRTESDLQKFHGRIRFAPLPQAYGNGEEAGDPAFTESALSTEGMAPDKALQQGDATDSDESDEDDEGAEEGDESWSRRLSGLGGGSRSRWYLMGMSKGLLKSQSSRSTRRPSSASGLEGAVDPLSASPGQERPLSAATMGPGSIGSATSGEQRRGRRSSRIRRSGSVANSLKSRSSSVGSIEEDDRKRRRQMIRASRPGGTGMLTLPDGTRIKARRVGEAESDEEEFNEWGDSPAVGRRNSVGDVQTSGTRAKLGDKRASDDEQTADDGDDSGSGMSWVKRRRREREEKAGHSASKTEDGEEEGKAQDKKSADRQAAERQFASSETSDAIEHEHTQRRATEVPPRPSVTPVVVPAPTLSASRMAEVRRRHEQEVAALGAEVLESLAKAKKAKQQQQQQQQQQVPAQLQAPVRSMTMDASMHAALEKGLSSGQASPTATQAAVRARGRPSRTTSLDEYGSHLPALLATKAGQSAVSSRSASQTGGPSMSPNQASQRLNVQTPLHTSEASDGFKTPTGLETPTRSRRFQSPSRLLSSPITVPESPGRAKKEESTVLPVLDPVGESDDAPVVDDGASRVSSESRPSISSYGQFSQSPGRNSMSSARGTSRGRLRNTAMPVPSPDLPRRPDARGYSVVPLPMHQLGRRPERPREGRVWQFDDVDDSSEGENLADEESEASSEDGESLRDGEGGAEEEEEEEGTAMNAEELAEEERRTAIQKQRATTRAAGAELVSSMAKAKTAANKGSSGLAASSGGKDADKTRSPRSSSKGWKGGKGGHGRKGSFTESPGRMDDNKPESSEAVFNGEKSELQSSPVRRLSSPSNAPTSREIPKGKQRRRSSRTEEVKDEAALSDDLSDDVALWPPTLSSMQLNRTTSAGQLESRPSQIRSSSSVSKLSSTSSNTVAGGSRDALALAAHSAKTKILRQRKSKEAKEKERLRILRLKENDEFLDYGWPRSLQGSSLYD